MVTLRDADAGGHAAPSRFLRVGDHVALDFLNTLPADRTGARIERLDSFASLVAWLEEASLLDPAAAARVRRAFARTGEGERALAAARRLRASLAAAAEAHLARRPVPARALADLNAALRRPAGHDEVRRAGDGRRLTLVRRFEPRRAEDLLAGLARAAADLLCGPDLELVRRCAGTGCVLWFLDRTRNRRRRWCDMALCGNRAKAAAHRRRRAKGRRRRPRRAAAGAARRP